MDIRVKEPLYILSRGQEYVVRPGTVGVEKNRIVFFYDVTRTASVGYPREFCLENPQMFSVARTLTDKEVYLKDVVKTLENFPRIQDNVREMLIEQLKAL